MQAEWLRSVFGRSLVRARGDFHLYQGRMDPVPISVWLDFDGCATVQVYGMSDGWRLGARPGEPKEFDMAEYGSFVVRELSKTCPLGSCTGAVLRSADVIASPGEDNDVGVILRFEDPLPVIVMNWGDETWIDVELPEDHNMGELEFRPVTPPGTDSA